MTTLDEPVAPPGRPPGGPPRAAGPRDSTVLDLVERALEQAPDSRAGWLAQHCPDELLDAARRILRVAEVTNADEQVTLALLTRQTS